MGQGLLVCARRFRVGILEGRDEIDRRPLQEALLDRVGIGRREVDISELGDVGSRMAQLLFDAHQKHMMPL